MLKFSNLLRKPAIIFGVLLFYLYFRGIGDHGLIDPVEGINASASIHMSASGNYFVPRIGDSLLAGKTMLTWWLSAFALKLFGWGEFAVRFWSAVSGLVMVWASAMAARSTDSESRRSSWLAASICASMTGCFVVSQLASSHAMYSCLTAITMAGAIRSQNNIRWLVPAHLASAFAFMAHGASGLFLPCVAVIVYSVLSEDWDMLRRFFTWPAGIIANVIISGFYLVSLIIINPELVHFMRCMNHVYTFGGITGELVFMFMCFVPWVGFIVRAVFETFPRSVVAERSPEFFLLVWALVFALGAVLSGDLLSIASCVPALSALLGRKLDVWLATKSLYSIRVSVMITVAVLVPMLYVLLPFTMNILPVVRASLMSLVPWGILAGLFIFGSWYYTKTKQIVKWVRNVPAAALLCLMPMAGVFNLTADAYAIKDVGRKLGELVEGRDTVIQYGVNHPSVYFYSLRNSYLIDAMPTLGLQERNFITNYDIIGRLWQGKERVFLIMDKDMHPETPLPQNITHILEHEGTLLLSNQ